MQFNMKTTLICLALLNGVAFASKAHAGDLPKRNQYSGPAFTQAQNQINWGGLYVGAHFGYGWGKARNADISGFLAGGQIGYNFQFDRAVFGIEADASYSGVDYRGFADTFRQKWLMSARGRIGYSYDRFLPYLTGGLAYSTNTMKAFGGKAENGHMGFVIGVGAEMMLTSNVSTRVEFLHYRFGAEQYALPLATRNTTVTTNTLRVGLNYKF